MLPTKLSDHFTLAEATKTATGIKNTPSPIILDRLILTADRMEKVRAICGGNPVQTNSWFRNEKVNASVGGVSNSDHLSGYAVDFTISKFGNPYRICAMIIASGIEFDQLIHERRRWVHISFAPSMRGEVLTLPVTGSKYKEGLIK